MKIYGGDTSVAPTSDDVEQATSVFREELELFQRFVVIQICKTRNIKTRNPHIYNNNYMEVRFFLFKMFL